MTMGKVNGKVCSCLVSNLLVVLTLSGVAVGLTVGLLVRLTNPPQDVVIWIGLPGDVFINSLQMVVLPLIVTSVIAGTASLDPKCNGKISVISLVYIFVTNSMACVVPIIITVFVQPGKPNEKLNKEMVASDGGAAMETIDVFADLIRNLFPPNIISACFEQFQTQYEYVNTSSAGKTNWNFTLAYNQTDHLTKEKFLGTVPSTNILGLVICSFFFGVAASAIGEEGRAFFVFFHSANAIIMKVLSWLIWCTPIGVISLIAKTFLESDHLDSIVKSLGMYSLLMSGCLFLHVFILTLVIHMCFLRTNPLRFFPYLGRAFVVAFATASSAMTMPEIFHALEEKMNIDSRVTRFTVPMAITINKDGSSIYIAVSCIFLAQMAGQSLNGGEVVILWALLTFICMAAPGVPSGALVVVTIILSSLGIPTHLVGLLFATEWLLDRFRSCVNVTSHYYCALLVAHFCQNSLPPLENTPEVPSPNDTPEVPHMEDTQDTPPLSNSPELPILNNTPNVPPLKNTPVVPHTKNTPDVPTLKNSPELPPLENIPELPPLQNIQDVDNLFCTTVVIDDSATDV